MKIFWSPWAHVMAVIGSCEEEGREGGGGRGEGGRERGGREREGREGWGEWRERRGGRGEKRGGVGMEWNRERKRGRSGRES